MPFAASLLLYAAFALITFLAMWVSAATAEQGNTDEKWVSRLRVFNVLFIQIALILIPTNTHNLAETGNHHIFMAGCVIDAAFISLVLYQFPSTRESISLFFIMIIVGLGPGCELAYALNGLVDFPAGETIHTKLLHKFSYPIPTGRSSQMIYELKLAPWSPVATAQDTQIQQVDRSLYDRLKEGDDVCIILHRGILQYPWIEINDCRK